mmetsp:Transcript_2557/g.2659  ORF Transcript_2557/g.2659 Transcript_2557/m.2659 type:complete len:99 (-) Transcript_2557:133-429(-)
MKFSIIVLLVTMLALWGLSTATTVEELKQQCSGDVVCLGSVPDQETITRVEHEEQESPCETHRIVNVQTGESHCGERRFLQVSCEWVFSDGEWRWTCP